MLYYKDENICGEIASPYFSRLRTTSDGVTLGKGHKRNKKSKRPHRETTPHKGGKANRVSVEPMTQSQMCDLVNMATEKVEQSQKSMAAVIKSAGHEMARFARTLYYKNGVSKITTEAEFQALLLYCGGKSGNGKHVSEGLSKDTGDKFVNEVGQQCLRAIAVQDRSLRLKVWKYANKVLTASGALPRSHIRWDVDNYPDMITFVDQDDCKKLAAAMLTNVRGNKAAFAILHGAAADALTNLGIGLKKFEFDGNEPLCRKVSIGFEALLRGHLWGFYSGRTYDANANNMLLEETKEKVNPRTVGVDAKWLNVLEKLKGDVKKEKKGDLTIDDEVAKEQAERVDESDTVYGELSCDILPETSSIMEEWND